MTSFCSASYSDDCNYPVLRHNCDSLPGQSGGPVWVDMPLLADGSRMGKFATGVNVASSEKDNFMVPLTPWHVTNLLHWVRSSGGT